MLSEELAIPSPVFYINLVEVSIVGTAVSVIIILNIFISII